MLDFIAENPWQFFFMGPFIIFLSWLLSDLAFKVWNRLLRTIKALIRGWPPEHLDADGDSIEAMKNEI